MSRFLIPVQRDRMEGRSTFLTFFHDTNMSKIFIALLKQIPVTGNLTVLVLSVFQVMSLSTFLPIFWERTSKGYYEQIAKTIQ